MWCALAAWLPPSTPLQHACCVSSSGRYLAAPPINLLVVALHSAPHNPLQRWKSWSSLHSDPPAHRHPLLRYSALPPCHPPAPAPAAPRDAPFPQASQRPRLNPLPPRRAPAPPSHSATPPTPPPPQETTHTGRPPPPAENIGPGLPPPRHPGRSQRPRSPSTFATPHSLRSPTSPRAPHQTRA
ncbi:unnamed protein product [Arctogadus glacialis]